MARIDYDDPTAAAYKRVREIPRDGLAKWRAAIRRHLDPSPGLADYLAHLDTLRSADTTMRTLTDEEFRRAARPAETDGRPVD